jgi:pimeloyl-ACP methyl ester carboxylesterase
MRPVTSLVLTLAVVTAVLLSPPDVSAQAKIPTKTVTIPTFDGVHLAGTLYPNSGGKRDAVVVLLHHFDAAKGGSSQSEGWSNLAAALHADGYTVLSFDFRGFGDSKTVDTKFWDFKHNQAPHLKGVKKKAQSIAHTNFNASYYPYLVNDVAAVRAYLDRRNDAREVNSSNIILIGAGDGSTVGAMWLAHEARRRRDKSGGIGMMLLGDPEVRDVAAAVWISPTANIGKKVAGAGQMTKWAVDAGGSKTNKVPMAFVFGKNDGPSDTIGSKMLAALKPMGSKGKDLPNTGVEKIAGTKLKGDALLDKDLDTVKWIVGTYLKKVMEDRGAREWNERSADKSPYWYTKGPNVSTPAKINKKPGEDVGPVDLPLIWPTVGP